MCSAGLPKGRPYCWIAGESGLPTGLRRRLVREHGISKEDITFLGYWREGVAAVS